MALSIFGSHVSAADSDYLSKAKQKVCNARDWSVQVTKESYGKAREKAGNAYVFTCQKTRALYEKAKEHKKLIAGAAYLAFEGVGLYNGWRTPFCRLFVLPGQLDGVTGERNAARNERDAVTGERNIARNALEAVQGNVANFNDVIIPALNVNINNLTNQCDAANVNIGNLNGLLNAANTTIEQNRLNIDMFEEGQRNFQNEIRTLRNTHDAALQDLRGQHQQALVQEQTQHGQTAARIGELQRTHDQEMQNLILQHQQQVQQLQAEVGSAFNQGKAQVEFEQRHRAIVNTIDNVEQELNNNRAIDSVGIIGHLIVQARELIQCRNLVPNAALNKQENLTNLANTFNMMVGLTQQTINHVVNQVTGGAEWLENETKKMHFSGVTVGNFDQNLEPVEYDIHNYFAQMNTAIDQIQRIAGLADKNTIIRSCLASFDVASYEAIVQSLGRMLLSSFEKIKHVLDKNGNDIVVPSYDDVFNLYVHSSVVTAACESYVKFCSLMPNSAELLAWVTPYEEATAYIVGRIPMIQVEASFEGGNSTLGNSVFLNDLSKTMIGALNYNLDQSSVNNFDLDKFFEVSTQSMMSFSALQEELMKPSMSTSSLFVSSVQHKDGNGLDASSVINIDDLLEHCAKKDDQDWDDELNAMGQSVIDWKESLIPSNLNNSFLAKSNLVSSFMGKSINLDTSKLSSSVLQWTNKAQKSCPFFSVDEFKSVEKERQDNFNNWLQSGGQFGQNVAGSRLPYFCPIGEKKVSEKSDIISNKLAQKNNNLMGDSSIISVSNIMNNTSEKASTNNTTNNSSSYTNGDLLGEFGESTTGERSFAQIAADSVFNAKKVLYERIEQERIEQALKEERLGKEKRDAALAKAKDSESLDLTQATSDLSLLLGGNKEKNEVGDEENKHLDFISFESAIL